jgi:low molecular weight phosphotyrosine protein phosphatase
MPLPNSAPATTSALIPTDRKPVSILFVCLGNICRSPLAEAVFSSLVSAHPTLMPLISQISSAGTSADYHSGAPPDPRTTATLKAHGIAGYKHKATKVTKEDFERYDWILAMDEENVRTLERMRKGRGTARVELLGRFGGREAEVVRDPYYDGGAEGFERAYEQCVRFTEGFCREVLGEEL